MLTPLLLILLQIIITVIIIIVVVVVVIVIPTMTTLRYHLVLLGVMNKVGIAILIILIIIQITYKIGMPCRKMNGPYSRRV